MDPWHDLFGFVMVRVYVCVYGTGKMQREILLYVVRMIQH